MCIAQLDKLNGRSQCWEFGKYEYFIWLQVLLLIYLIYHIGSEQSLLISRFSLRFSRSLGDNN